MKITAIEIRQHTFDKVMRGYKPEDVDAFLSSLSQEWERASSDHKMLKMQLEIAEKELGKLKEVEMTLFRTLKTAEDTSIQITDQANKTAEQYVASARQKADEMLSEARKRSAMMVQDAENQARYLKDNILNDIKAMEHDFNALEKYKENLGIQIRTLAANAVDSVDRFEKKFAKQDLKGKIEEVSTQIEESRKAGKDAETNPQSAAVADEQPAAETNPQPANIVADSPIELPPVIERETAIPEAIPADEPLVEKLNDAIDDTHDMAANAVNAVENGVAHATDVAAESVREVAAQPVETANAVKEEVITQTEEVGEAKKGGSFFDQI
ncbi:MAG: DivIVA domain-containing protein [Spirosoma sp.]|nr:DivIVA domain-containing protein [Spirosoma sp.]